MSQNTIILRRHAILVRRLGTSPVAGHRLVIVLMAQELVGQWISTFIPPLLPWSDLAQRPAYNIIMSIPEGVSNEEVADSIKYNQQKLLGMLKASRGCAQDTPCTRCATLAGRAPFEQCFKVNLGAADSGYCASCEYAVSSDATIEQGGGCCSQQVSSSPDPGPEAWHTNNVVGRPGDAESISEGRIDAGNDAYNEAQDVSIAGQEEQYTNAGGA